MKDKIKRFGAMLLGFLSAWKLLDWFVTEKLKMFTWDRAGQIALACFSAVCLWYGAVVPAVRSLRKALAPHGDFGIEDYEKLLGVLWPLRAGKIIPHPCCKHLSQFSFAPNDFPGHCKECDCWAPFKGSELKGKLEELKKMGKKLEEDHE